MSGSLKLGLQTGYCTDTGGGWSTALVAHDSQLHRVPDGMSDAQMQSLAAEMNLSETTFVLPPADPANTARVRIFNCTAEMPFADYFSTHTQITDGCAAASEARVTGRR